jgi:branched-chain amino acid transport system permease protein
VIASLLVCTLGILSPDPEDRIGSAMRCGRLEPGRGGAGGVNSRVVILLTAFLAGATSGLAGGSGV